MEYGIFCDEGLLEGGFFGIDSAERALAERYESADEAWVARICPDHAEQEQEHCELCGAEDD